MSITHRAMVTTAGGEPHGRTARWRHAFTGRGEQTERTAEEEFVAFAEAAAPRLRRTAYLMCRDWHLAHDLTQITLAKMYVSWKRIYQSADLAAYSRKVLVRSLLDQRRRRSAHELATAEVPESLAGAGGTDRPELRLTLIDALSYLPVRDRAIVVLRYWEDHSVDTVAEMLGVSVAVVKTQSARSLARLRALLGDSRAELVAE